MDHPVDEAISLWLSFPAIWVGILVFTVSGWTLYRTIKSEREITREAQFIFGIFIGFLGGSLDSIYWLIPWSLDFMNDPNANWWFKSGALPNIFFRQLCDIVGGIFHLVALLVAFGPFHKRFAVITTISSFVVGVVYVFVLYAMRLP